MKNSELFSKQLLDVIPEFKKYQSFKDSDVDLDLSYIVYGIFADFYVEKVHEDKMDLVKRMSNFIESLLERNDKDVEELIAYGFLENIDIDPATPEYKQITDTFGKKTLSVLDGVHEFWRKAGEFYKK